MITDEQDITLQATLALTERSQALVGVAGIKTVTLGRSWPMDADSLPATVLYWPDDDYLPAKGFPGRRRIAGKGAIRIVTAFARAEVASDKFEWDAGAIRLSVKRIIASDPYLRDADGPLVKDLHVTSVRTGFDPMSANTVMVVIVNVAVEIDHMEADPTRPLSRLNQPGA